MELTNGKFVNAKDFSTLGVEVGMYVTLVSAKGSYNGSAQAVGSGLLNKRAATTEEAAYVDKYEATVALGKMSVAEKVGEDFTLDKKASWTSNNAAIAIETAEDGTVTGKVTRGAADIEVTLTATVTVNGQSVSKEFNVVVIAATSTEATSVAKITFGKSGNAQQESKGSYTDTWKATVGDQEWQISNFNNNSNGWEYIRCGKSNNTGSASITTTIAAKAVKKIVINAKFPTSNAQLTTLVVNVKNADGEVVETKTLQKTDVTANGNTEIALEKATAGCTYEIVFNYSNTTKNNGKIDVMSVDYLG